MLLSELPLSGGMGSAALGGFEATGVAFSGPSLFELQAGRRSNVANMMNETKPKIPRLLLRIPDGDGTLVIWGFSDDWRGRIVFIAPRQGVYGHLAWWFVVGPD